MGWTPRDSASTNSYTNTSISAPAITVVAGDLIVVGAGQLFDTDPYVTSFTDTAGNTYTLRANMDGERTDRVGYCINALGNASNVITANFSDGTDSQLAISVASFQPSSPTDVSIDDQGWTKQSGYEATPWETSEDDTTGSDEICVAYFGSDAHITFSDPEIPIGTAADGSTLGNRSCLFWAALATPTTIAAQVDSSSSTYYQAEMLCFNIAEASSSSSSSSQSISASSSSSSESVSVSSSSSSESTSISSSSSSESTSVSSSSSSESTSVSSSSSSLSLSSVGWTWGEQNPDPETAVEWSVWKIKETISDARDSGNWGELQLGSGEEFVSDVKDMGSVLTRYLILTYDDYASGSGSGTLYWRGQAAGFDPEDNEIVGPAWEEYTGPANKTWRYVQVMCVG